MYTFDQAYEASLKYFNGDEIAAQKFVSKYALQNTAGEFMELTPEDLHRRLAREFARIEAKYPNAMSEDEIFSLLDRFKYVVAQGSPMSGIGNPFQIQSLSNCFVIESPFDSYGGILKTDQEMVQIMKRRGGVGFDLSTIRPKGMVTANAARTTDGIEVFMERWSNSCREVAQGGRRGALMLTISCHHPQIRDFIAIKRDLKKVTGANISIRLSDEFMRAVKDDTDVELRFPVEADADHLMKTTTNARKIWDEMIDAAHNAAEPGLLFWDNIISGSPADIYSSFGFKTISTNPCAELPICADDSCRLILVNAVSFVVDAFTSRARVDWELYRTVVKKAQRLMDDVIDLEIECIDKIIAKIANDPEPADVKETEIKLWNRIRNKVLTGRRTGLGLTGVGDLLAMLGVRYGSEQSFKIIDAVYRELAIWTYRSSAEMAKERGAFPIHDYELEKNHVFLRRLFDADPELEEMVRNFGRRNIACNTTAPAGTVSIMTQTTSGIEPVFLISYTRRSKISSSDKNATVSFVDELGDRWQEFGVFHHGFKRWMEATGKTPDDVEESPYWKSTSNDIDWESKVRLQATAQRWIDHSISNTTNIPSDATIETTKKVYMTGWESGCKGVTIYRAGSRSGVLVEKKTEQKTRDVVKRPKELPCKIHHANIKNETWTIVIGLLDGKPHEVFGGLSRFVEIPKKYDEGIVIKNEKKTTSSTYDLKIGNGTGFVIKNIVEQFDNPNYSVMTRMISLALRHGAKIQYVVEQLQKGDRDSDMFSFNKVIARVLKSYIEDGSETTMVKQCTQCSSTNFAYQEGCPICLNCGWQKCG